MNIKKILFYLLAGILGGCVPVMSLHRLYTEKELVFEEKLLGTWSDANNESTWEFSCPEQASKKYQLVYADDEERKGLFEVHLVKLEDELFLDVYPAQFPCDIEDPNKTEWFYNTFFLVPAHTFIKIDYIESLKSHINRVYKEEEIGTAELKQASKDYDYVLTMCLTDDDELKKLLEENPNAIKFESVDDKPVLTASTKNLQKFFLKYADDERVFSGEFILLRKKITDPNDVSTIKADPDKASQNK